MQAAEYVRFAAQVRSQAEAGRIAARAGIEPAKRLCSLDARERRTLAAACALATDRDVILLDEPFESSPSPSPLIEWIEEVKRAGSAVLIASNAAGAIDARVLELADGRLSAAAPAAAGGVSR